LICKDGAIFLPLNDKLYCGSFSERIFSSSINGTNLGIYAIKLNFKILPNFLLPYTKIAVVYNFALCRNTVLLYLVFGKA